MTQMMEALRRFAEDCAQTHFQRLPHEIIIERAVDFVEKTEVQPRVFRIKNLHSNLLFVVKFYPSERFDITMIEHLAAAGGMLGQLKLQKALLIYLLLSVNVSKVKPCITSSRFLLLKGILFGFILKMGMQIFYM